MLTYKAGVRVSKRTLALCHLENCLLGVQDDLGYPKLLVITSINDGTHSQKPVSRHYSDEAIDIRTKGSGSGGMGSVGNKVMFTQSLREKLGDLFYVMLEQVGTSNEHIHAQVKKGSTYP